MLIVWLLILLTAGCGQALRNLDGLPAIVIATDKQLADKDVVPNRYIAMFKSHTGIDRTDFANYHEETGFYSGFLAERYDYDYEVKDIRLITSLRLPEADYTPPYSLQWRSGTRSQAVGIITEVTFASNDAARKYLHEWHAKGMLYFAEPVYISHPTLSDSFKQIHTTYSEASEEGGVGGNWWHREISLIKAFNLIAENNSAESDCEPSSCRFKSVAAIKNPPVIAVLDSGIDYKHPLLAKQMFTKKPNLDHGCGRTDEHGCNTAQEVEKGLLGGGDKAYPWGAEGAGKKCPATHRACGHGTHVAGIIAADVADQGSTPMLGVCPFCKILNINVMSTSGKEKCKIGSETAVCHNGSVTDSSLLNALKYIEVLVRSGVNIKVINASIGKFHRSRSVSLLAANLRKPLGEISLGVISVAAAGNEDTMIRNYPAALDNVISVAATAKDGRKSSFSNYGAWIDIAAPGGGAGAGIESSVPGGSTHPDMGTSMAAPVVSGVLGLVYAVDNEAYTGNKGERLDAKIILKRLRHFSNEVKLYCLHPKSQQYASLPPVKNIRITAKEYQEAKTNKFREHCPQFDLTEIKTRKEALRNVSYYVEFVAHAEKIPLIGLGMVDAEAMLRRSGGQLNPLMNFTLALDRVNMGCGSIRSIEGGGGAVLLLLLLGCIPVALVFRFKE